MIQRDSLNIRKGVEMSKAAIIAISVAFITLIGFISTLSVWNHNLGKENAKLKAELANASTLLDVQNKALEKQKLDTEAYKKQAKETKERIITRYQTITTPAQVSKDCQAELEAIKQALGIFYDRESSK